MNKRISVTEAHEHFGDLARIRNGVTRWAWVVTPLGVWMPAFSGIELVAYEFIPGEAGSAALNAEPREVIVSSFDIWK